MKKGVIITAIAMLLAASASADDGKPPSSRSGYSGLSVFANAGGYWADNNTADFYSGRPTERDRTGGILRILHSNTYGQQIWSNLRTNGLISDAISNPNQLTVEEYADRMYYRTSYQIGLGVRYDYETGFGWLLRFDRASLRLAGAFNLSASNGTGMLGSNRYVSCNIMGQEDRINIDFALAKSVSLGNNIELEVDLGASLINTKVKENAIEIAGQTYSILDRWNGNIPDEGIASYEYINQGGVGYGVFMSIELGYRVANMGALKIGYTCYQSKTVLEGYTAWGWNHMLGVRVEMNNLIQ